MRSAVRLFLLLPLLAIASGLGTIMIATSTAGASAPGVPASIGRPTGEPMPTETTAPPVLCPPICPSESPTAEPTTAAPKPTATVAPTPRATRTPTRTRSPRPQRTSDPNVQLPTGVPAPVDIATGEATPTPAAEASDPQGGESDPALRLVQAAVGIALLLALLGGFGLYYTREHR